MGRTSVRRRLVYIKKTKNPVVALPKKSPASDAAVSETAKSAPVIAASVPRSSPPRSGAVNLAKFAAMFAVAVCAGGGAAVMQNNRTSAPSDYVETAAPPVIPRPAPSRTVVSDPGLQGNALPAVLAQRSAPTDASFRASAYVRRR